MTKSEKQILGTYRAGPYIFIEEASFFRDDRNQLCIKARYIGYNAVTMSGMTKPKRNTRTFKVSIDERVLTYRGTVFPCKNLSEILLEAEKLNLVHN